MYTCLECNHEFRQSGNLFDHIRTHTGDRPFICDVCNKGKYIATILTSMLLVIWNLDKG